MAKFPDAVVSAMYHTKSTVTCLPVQVDGGEWAAALFFVLPESYNENAIKQLFQGGMLFPVGLEADLVEKDSATFISLGIQIDLGEAQPQIGEVIFLTGYLDTHFETVKSLSEQTTVNLFIGDCFCNLLHQQTIPLGDEHRAAIAELLKEASSRDALIRFRGQYDPELAFKEITGHSASGASTVTLN